MSSRKEMRRRLRDEVGEEEELLDAELERLEKENRTLQNCLARSKRRVRRQRESLALRHNGRSGGIL